MSTKNGAHTARRHARPWSGSLTQAEALQREVAQLLPSLTARPHKVSVKTSVKKAPP